MTMIEFSVKRVTEVASMPCQDRRMRRLLLSGLMLVAVLAVPSLAAAKGQLLFGC